MKADSTDQANASGVSASEPVNDPFAVDLFAGSRPPADALLTEAAASPVQETKERTDGSGLLAWQERLPRVSEKRARLSAALARLPPPLSSEATAMIVRFLARYTNVPADEISVSVVDLREAELMTFARRAETAPRVFLSFAFEPDGARLSVEMITGFVSVIVDRVLGGEGSSPGALRPLSKTEQAVFEFLCLSLIHDFNEEMREPLLRLDAVTPHPPTWLRGDTTLEPVDEATLDTDTLSAHGFIMAVRFWLGSKSAVARVYIPSDSLDAMRHPLLFASRAPAPEAKIEQHKRFTSHVRLRLLIGETNVAAAELVELERGDVLIVERPRVQWRDGRIKGEALVCAGEGRTVTIAGSIRTTAKLPYEEDDHARHSPPQETIQLVSSGISTAHGRSEAERLIMEEGKEVEENSDAAEGLLALDELLLTVRVELAARRISLDELARLRAGQVLELGCRATDPVELITEDRRIARGELVDIEGRLGVRITQLLS